MPVVMNASACDSDAQNTWKFPQIQYIVKIFGVPVARQHQVPTVPVRRTTDACDSDVQQDDPVELPQAQHTERDVDIAVVRQRQASAIQTVQETAEVPQSRWLDRVVDLAVGIQRQTTDDPMLR